MKSRKLLVWFGTGLLAAAGMLGAYRAGITVEKNRNRAHWVKTHESLAKISKNMSGQQDLWKHLDHSARTAQESFEHARQLLMVNQVASRVLEVSTILKRNSEIQQRSKEISDELNVEQDPGRAMELLKEQDGLLKELKLLLTKLEEMRSKAPAMETR